MIGRFLPFVLALVLPAGVSAQITPPPPSSADTVPEQIAEAALTCQFLLDATVPVSVVIVANFTDGSNITLQLSCEQVMQRFDRSSVLMSITMQPSGIMPTPAMRTRLILSSRTIGAAL